MNQDFLITDEELACQSQAGSLHSFDQLIVRNAPKLLGYFQMRSVSKQDAEDLVQETLLRAFTHIGNYDPAYRFSTWLYTIATRLLISFWRKAKPNGIIGEAEHGCQTPEDQLIVSDSCEKIWLYAKKLEKRQHQVLWLRYKEEFSIQEVAKIMGITAISVRVLLFRARKFLAGHLDLTINSDRLNPKK